MLQKLLLICLFCLLGSNIYAGDSVSRRTFRTHTREGICARVESGWNKSWFQSVGVSYLVSQFNGHGAGSLVAYAGAEVNYANYTTATPYFMGYKAGAEFGGGMVIAAEVKLYSGNSGEYLVFIPKIGFSALGRANLLYGYNAYDEHSNFYGVGRHQISFNYNFTVFKIRDEISYIHP